MNDFRQNRRKGIGGSDVAGILGISPWESPLSIYHSKVSDIDDDLSDNPFVKWGTILEEPIAKEFESVTGKKVRKNNQQIISKDHPFLLANIDRDIVGETAGLEIKTASEYKKSDWVNGVPAYYLTQCLHYMYVTGASHWYIAVLVGGNHFDWYKIDRDEDTINMIVDKCVQFWNDFVLKKVPPKPTSLDNEVLKSLFPAGNGEQVDLDSDSLEIIQSLSTINESLKSLENLKTELENVLKNNLGDNEIGRVDNYFVSWKNYEANRIDTKRLKEEQPSIFKDYVKKSSYRRFNIKEVKS
jgi:putative phage-type endonuclease